MQDYGQEYMPYMQMMGVPSQYYPMATMPQEQLEDMYPQEYYTVYPLAKQKCDMWMSQFGPMQTPTREQLDAMVQDICANAGPQMGVNEAMEPVEANVTKDRQFFFGGRRFLPALASILLIRELIGRRRPFFGYGYPGYGYGYGYGFPGYGYPGYF